MSTSTQFVPSWKTAPGNFLSPGRTGHGESAVPRGAGQGAGAHGLASGAGLALSLLLFLLWCFPVRAADSTDPHEQVTEGLINAPVAEVWRLFTTAEGFKATGVAYADVDLRIGGLIRSQYDPKGQLGDPETVVNEILAYEPERMLAMRIKQPPASFPHRDAVAGTWTVIYFTPAGADMTLVRIVGMGYRDDAPSQAMREFFAKGNRWTLDEMAKRYRPLCKLCEKEAKEGKR